MYADRIAPFLQRNDLDRNPFCKSVCTRVNTQTHILTCLFSLRGKSDDSSPVVKPPLVFIRKVLIVCGSLLIRSALRVVRCATLVLTVYKDITICFCFSFNTDVFTKSTRMYYLSFTFFVLLLMTFTCTTFARIDKQLRKYTLNYVIMYYRYCFYSFIN